VASRLAAARARGTMSGGSTVVRGHRILLVHRPKYDDWTFPKGKAENGETDEECALREVHEETGLTCELVTPAGVTEYFDSRGRPKVVHWFVMHPLGGEFEPTDEVDELRWESTEDAAELLSYERDVPLLAAVP